MGLRKTQKLGCFLLSLVLLFCLLPLPALAEAPEQKTVRVGWYEDAYHITGRNGERSGYGYEYEQAVAAYTGWRFEYVQGGWSELLEKLQNGEIDLMSTLSYTEDRAGKMLFSELPMGTERYYLYADLVHTDISASDLSTLNGKRVDLMRESVISTQFFEWAEKNGVSMEPVYSETFEEGKENAANRLIDCVVSTETPEWVEFGMSAIAVVGGSDIYYGISKKRPDLKEELDTAMRKMENDKPFYADELYQKYLSAASSPVLDQEESAWLSRHGAIRVGYVEGDSGFSNLDPVTGELTGVVQDYIGLAEDCLGEKTLSFQMVGFASQEEELQGLKNGKIDFIFHASQNPYEAERNDLILSNTVLEVPLAAVTTKELFNESAENSVAIPKGELALKWHVSYYYPKWTISEYDSLQDAQKAVKEGKADCFLTKSGQLSKYIEDKKLNSVFLTQPCNISFLVGRDQTTLMSILNKTLETMQSTMLTGALSMYDNASNKVTVVDFIKDNLLVFSAVCGSVFLLILLVILNLLKKAQIAESKAKAAQAQAEDANAAKSVFLFNMSHDIRTPMNALLGYNALMKKELTDPKLLSYQEKIEQSGNLLLSIINNVLDMARIESGKMELDENYSQVGDLLKNVCQVFEVEAKKKNITLSYETHVTHKHILCDVTQVQKILLNLVSNAVKYTPSGGSVTIISQEIPCEREGYVRIKTEVADTGIGIGKEYLPHIFDSFSRERNTTMGRVAGTGLGMAIVKKLVDRMGGTIDVESEVGKGTKFILILPHKIADERYYDQAANEKSVELRNALLGKRVLLAEDNDLNAEIATTILEDMGLRIDRVEDGIQCVSRVEQMPAGTYDLILMDIQMPNMDGYKATETIRSLKNKRKASIPIVAMTANAFEEDKKEAFDRGMNGHIAKPIDIKNVEEVLFSILR